MRLPRDISGEKLGKKLQEFGYQITRQTGSHLRLTTQQNGEHHITIPNHPSLRIGTLANILSAVAQHFEISKENIIAKLFK